MRALVAVEVLSVLAFATLAAWSVRSAPDPLPAIDAAALATGPADETWTGIFLDGQHIGYSVSREAPAEGGGRLWQSQSAMRIGSMGEVQDVVTAGTAVTDAEGRLLRFDFLLSSPMQLVGVGRVEPGNVHLELSQAGQVSVLDIPVEAPPTLSTTLSASLRGHSLVAGQSFQVPYFDPITMSTSPMTVLVESPETLPTGDVGWWIRTSLGSVSTRRLVDQQGEVLREESELGFSSVRMTREQAMAVDEADPPDVVALVSVPVKGGVRRGLTELSLRIEGVDPAKIADEPGLQTREGDVVHIRIPALDRLPSLPIAGEGDTEPTPFLPALHPEIQAKAKELVAGAADRREAARRIAEWVHRYVAKMPTIGVPNGLEVLRTGRGDCNEHTALFVSLARAVGIPSRIAAGLVWSDRMGDAFYYHAWPEVKLGDGVEGPSWVPVDPTFGQFPADATHLKILNGDLDRQVEIMGVMGRIRLEAQ